jgi:hypothetical protein
MLAPLFVVKVNVEVLMVAGFIALLNTAVIMVALGHTPTLPLTGVTRITVGGVWGAVGIPAFLLLFGLQHPAAKPSVSSARNKSLWFGCSRIHILFFSLRGSKTGLTVAAHESSNSGFSNLFNIAHTIGTEVSRLIGVDTVIRNLHKFDRKSGFRP